MLSDTLALTPQLVLDWELGEITGLTLLKQLREEARRYHLFREAGGGVAHTFTACTLISRHRPNQIPDTKKLEVIFITSNELEPSVLEECKVHGASRFWQKPLTMETIQVRLCVLHRPYPR